MTNTVNSISARIVEAVARTSGVDPQALPPLRNAVETDALEALYKHASGDGRTVPDVSFLYAGYEVHIHSPTDIEIREADTADST